MVKQIYNYLAKEPLYRNSIYLMASNFIMAGLGFFFWTINTRLFTAEQVGLATTLISAMALITTISLLGLNVGLIRYLPKSKRKNDKINSSFIIISLAAIIVSAIFLLGLKIFSPKLLFAKENLLFAILFVIFTTFSSLSETIKNVFIAFRSAEYVLLHNSIFSILKLIFPFLFISLRAYGIFSSWMVALIIAFITSLIILVTKFGYKFRLTIKKDVIKKMTLFSFGNYIAGFLEATPRLVLPLMITNLIGAETTAYFYITMMIASLLFMTFQAICDSFFAESSTNEKELGKHTKKVVRELALVLIPTVLGIVFFGKYVLLFFGKAYSIEGFRFLQLLAISGAFVAVNSMFGVILRIKQKMKNLIFINAIGALCILGLSYLLISKSLIGIGLAWLIGQGVVSVIYLATASMYKS